MKTQNIFMSAAMLAFFLLATLSLVIRLVQFAVETVQTVLVAILFVAKIACKMVKATQHLLSSFEWLLSAIQGIFDAIHSSLEGWMVSTVPSDPTDDRPTPLLASANPFPSERTAFEEKAIASLEPIAQHVQPATTNSLELAIAPTTLMLTVAKSFPSERTAFEYYAISLIANHLKRQTHQIALVWRAIHAESTLLSYCVGAGKTAIASVSHELTEEAIVEVTAQLLGRVITIGNETGLIPLSFPGMYIQRTPKQEKLSKSELESLTASELRDRIAKAVKNNNSLVAPKSYKKAKKAVLVNWLMAN